MSGSDNSREQQATAAAAAESGPQEPHYSSDSSDDGEKKHYSISQTLFESLLLRGFSENAIKKSIVAGCIDESTCTQWIKMHEGHPELDTPLEDGVEVTVKVKRVLTESEREEKVRELQEKIRLKKEEEKREAILKERERVEMGRKALEVKEELEAVRRKMELEEVRRQKAADAAARRRVKIQIIADRYVRQGKGTEEAWQLAEQDVEAEAERARAAAAERAQRQLPRQSAAGSGDSGAAWNLAAVVEDTSAEDKLQALLSDSSRAAAAQQDTEESLVAAIKGLPGSSKCLEILRTILTNILASPLDVKKRTLRTSTKAFSQHIRPFEPALQLLRLCNFALSVDSEGMETVRCNTVVVWRLESVLRLLQESS